MFCNNSVVWKTCFSFCLIYLMRGYLVSAQSLDGDTVTIAANLLPLSLDPPYICDGAMQVDLVDGNRLLVGLSTNSATSGGIGYLELANLSLPVSVVYGNVSANGTLDERFADGTGTFAGIVQPNSFHQMQDNTKILFVDQYSCAREVDRNTGTVSTVIGVGGCGRNSLDIMNSTRSVYGMAYHESRAMWIFSVDTQGVYTYTRIAGGGYERRLLLPYSSVSFSVPDVMRQLYLDSDILWHKVWYGVNKYDLMSVNSTEQLQHDNSMFVRFMSSPGLSNQPDSTSKYQYNTTDLQLDRTDADISLSPDKQRMALPGIGSDRLHFMEIDSGIVWSVCTKVINGTPTDGSAQGCTFKDITAGVWIDSYTALIAENSPLQFRRIQIMRSTLTSSATSTQSNNAAERQTPYAKAEESTWWIVLAIAIGFCSPLLIFWIVIKVIQCRRHGVVFDIFSDEEDDGLDPLEARNINFLYNMAARGQHYEGKKKTTPNKERKSRKKYRTKSAESNEGSKKKKSKIPAKLQDAAESLAEKFKLPKISKRKKKTPAADNMEDELFPVRKATSKPKAKKSKRSSVDIVHAGTTVSVPMTKTMVGRARPLPTIPTSNTL